MWREIEHANHLRPGKPLLVGQFLRLPHLRPRATSSRVHTAESGRPMTASQTRSVQPSVQQPLPNPPHLAHVPNTAAPDQEAVRLARPVLFPAFKYKLEHTVKVFEFPNLHVVCEFTGEITMQKKGIITGGLTFTPQGIEVEYKKEADGVLRDFFYKCTGSIEDGKAKVGLAAGATVRQGDTVLSSSEIEPEPPFGMKYTCQGREIKLTYRDFDITGVLGYVMHAQPKSNSGSPQPSPAPAVNWSKVVGTGLILAAVVIVVADIVKDGATFGAGAAESPLSFAAAARLMGAGIAAFRSTAY